ncbi:hypothetical protein J2Z31_000371 [Sinorhizobium kostiense]|uniref:Uncharacterized protein n=1 Tax=Sinorhizobium kostiense TaxID=76747 RepID=A0ABS4QT91_9HYPH|nr:hypothetical protein [Sinorhizobium kostiense]
MEYRANCEGGRVKGTMRWPLSRMDKDHTDRVNPPSTRIFWPVM